MNKTHKITIAASAGALVLALGGGVVAYGSYHTKQVSQISTQVQAANQQTQVANKAKATAEAQVQVQAKKLNLVYSECLNQAKKAKTSDIGAACAD